MGLQVIEKYLDLGGLALFVQAADDHADGLGCHTIKVQQFGIGVEQHLPQGHRLLVPHVSRVNQRDQDGRVNGESHRSGRVIERFGVRQCIALVSL